VSLILVSDGWKNWPVQIDENREWVSPVATNASVRPPAKHVRIGTEMQVLFPALGVFLVVFGRFLPPRHPPDSVPVTCTRLKKMQATACIKIAS